MSFTEILAQLPRLTAAERRLLGQRALAAPKRSARTSWPRGFWRSIRVSDPAFGRGPQGKAPRRPALDE
jgi:hypothetical protein